MKRRALSRCRISSNIGHSKEGVAAIVRIRPVISRPVFSPGF